MIITTNTSVLSLILSKVKQAINPKNAMPILQNVLFHEKDGEYYLIGSSTEQWIQYKILLSVEGKWFDFCLPVGRVISALSLLPDQPMTMVVDDEKPHGIEFHVMGENGKETKISVSSVDAISYPIWEHHDFIREFKGLQVKSLLPCIKEASKYSAQDLLHPVMNGIYLDFYSDRYVVVASDGHRLYKNVLRPTEKLMEDGEQANTNIPKDTVSLLLSTMMKEDSVDVAISDNVVKFSTQDITIMATVLAGKYPRYDMVIPCNNEKEAVFAKQDLMRSVKLVRNFASATSDLVAINFNMMLATVSAKDLDFGEDARDSVLLVNQKNLTADFQIGLKASTLLACLSDVQSENVKMQMNLASTAVLIREDDENSELTLLLMPMIVDD